jgi:hypothetical protein
MASPRFILKTELTGLEPVAVGGAAMRGCGRCSAPIARGCLPSR